MLFIGDYFDPKLWKWLSGTTYPQMIQQQSKMTGHS